MWFLQKPTTVSATLNRLTAFWERLDHPPILTSLLRFDGEMISMVRGKVRWAALHVCNGNNYGYDGIGLAVEG